MPSPGNPREVPSVFTAPWILTVPRVDCSQYLSVFLSFLSSITQNTHARHSESRGFTTFATLHSVMTHLSSVKQRCYCAQQVPIKLTKYSFLRSFHPATRVHFSFAKQANENALMHKSGLSKYTLLTVSRSVFAYYIPSTRTAAHLLKFGFIILIIYYWLSALFTQCASPWAMEAVLMERLQWSKSLCRLCAAGCACNLPVSLSLAEELSILKKSLHST